jgi:hypothetical protein
MGAKMERISTADANASRAFFVRMLTRDISVEDCILDLIDNSVDSAWKKLGKVPLTFSTGPDFSNVKINLTFNDEKFQISDNCGGMSQASAEKHALTFGRKDQDPEDSAEFSIGVYGIGLKRAIFKMGTSIEIRSTHHNGVHEENFAVPIDVNQWVTDTSNDWEFPIVKSLPLESDGISIKIEGLTSLAEFTFSDPDFEGALVNTIARDYALHLHKGLKIFVNGNRVKGEEFKLYTGEEFSPQFVQWTESIDGKEVKVEIVAGFAFPPPNDNNPTERRGREEKSGWYVACNGRIVMAADKSALTVWGDDFPAWHPQYTGFMGLIAFTADDTELLPLTTTKRSVDLSSIVYRRSRPKMKEPTRAWISYTNSRKIDQVAAEVVEQKAQRESIFAIKPQPQLSVPQIAKGRARETIIQFSMEKTRITALGGAFGNTRMSAREVGVKAFNYSYDELVGGE